MSSLGLQKSARIKAIHAACRAAGIGDDTRHTAATRLAGKLDVLTLCKVFGWTSPNMALVYYNPAPGEIARRMG